MKTNNNLIPRLCYENIVSITLLEKKKKTSSQNTNSQHLQNPTHLSLVKLLLVLRFKQLIMSYSMIIRRNINSIINNRKDEKAKTNKVSRKGHVALYVGKGKKRYEVPVKYLSHPSIQKLIILSQHDELETKIDGPIELACTIQFFEELLILAKKYY